MSYLELVTTSGVNSISLNNDNGGYVCNRFVRDPVNGRLFGWKWASNFNDLTQYFWYMSDSDDEFYQKDVLIDFQNNVDSSVTTVKVTNISFFAYRAWDSGNYLAVTIAYNSGSSYYHGIMIYDENLNYSNYIHPYGSSMSANYFYNAIAIDIQNFILTTIIYANIYLIKDDLSFVNYSFGYTDINAVAATPVEQYLFGFDSSRHVQVLKIRYVDGSITVHSLPADSSGDSFDRNQILYWFSQKYDTLYAITTESSDESQLAVIKFSLNYDTNRYIAEKETSLLNVEGNTASSIWTTDDHIVILYKNVNRVDYFAKDDVISITDGSSIDAEYSITTAGTGYGDIVCKGLHDPSGWIFKKSILRLNK